MGMTALRGDRRLIRVSMMLTLAGLWAPAFPVVAQTGAPPSTTMSPLPTAAPDSCGDLMSLELKDTTLFSAVRIRGADGVAYCRVQGAIRPAINFELRLPTGWNHKFLMAGCGGFCGGMLTESPVFVDALHRGYATVVTDTGHWGAQALDARWARNNAVAREDFSWRGVKETTDVSKAIVRAFYGHDIAYSYYDGCSNGGRQGLMEASRFPQDYDGVISGAPARDVVGLTALFAWTGRSDTGADGRPILTSAAINLLQQAVTRECAGADGLVEDQATCKFRPESLSCKPGSSGDCLTAAQVEAADRLYEGPVSASGQRLFPSGEPFGSERFWMPPGSPNALLPLKIAGQGLVNDILAAPGSAAPAASADFGQQVAQLHAVGDPMTPSSDLRAFAARKGKLLLYQGTADQMVPPATTVEYYDAAAKALGADAKASIRLFMVPGMAHCANPAGVSAPGFDIADIDPLTAMEQWVEHGVAPAALPARKPASSGHPAVQRQLCAYHDDDATHATSHRRQETCQAV